MLKYILLFLLSTLQLFALVDLNNASSSELLELNGIGKAKSQKIIEYREVNKCFKTLDELSNIEGISKKIISSNKNNLTLGICKIAQEEEKISPLLAIKNVLLDPINILFAIIIFLLAFLDIKTGKDFKSQIISMGVLGTFVGVFIGLQGFDPADITNSVNDILVGLKTAFFTSIVGMSVSTILSITQELKANPENK